MSTEMVTLKEKTNKVIADKVFGKAIIDYGERSRRNVLVVTEFENRAEIIVSNNIAKKLEKKPKLVEALQELFELRNDEEVQDDYSIVSNRGIHLPKLSVPFKDVSRGWNNDMVVDQTTLYLNILGYGKGGSKSLVDTKFKNAEKPEWWDDSNNFEKYSHPSKVKMKVNEDVIESILRHHGYDPMTHCEIPEPKVKKTKKSMRKNKKRILGESLIEDDPAILDLRVDSNDNNDEGNKTATDDESEDDWEDSDEKTDDVDVVPKKKTKKQLANPKLSWFEENVIKKNIKEREELAKKLGIDNIADEFRNAAKR